MGATLDSAWAGQIFAPPTALDIATIESAIAAQLRAQVSAIEVAQFPDKPAAYRLTHRIGAALVAWRGATYGALIDTARWCSRAGSNSKSCAYTGYDFQVLSALPSAS